MSKPFTIACIPAYNEEGRIASVVVRARRRVDAVVVCDDGSGDLMGEIAETTCFYVSIFMDR
jgi:glycosyltransferase involved in cell wall biosynthesis